LRTPGRAARGPPPARAEGIRPPRPGRAGGRGPRPPGCFKAINVKAVDLDGDGVFNLLVFTAVRKGKT